MNTNSYTVGSAGHEDECDLDVYDIDQNQKAFWIRTNSVVCRIGVWGQQMSQCIFWKLKKKVERK